MSARKSKPPAARKAVLQDIIADGQYRDHDIEIPTRDGTATWRVNARELSWEEQSQIGDKHTKVIQSGRGQDERRIVNQTAIMAELLDRMIDGPKCDPPMQQAEVRKIRGPLLQTLADHFGLSQKSRQEDEQEAGE